MIKKEISKLNLKDIKDENLIFSQYVHKNYKVEKDKILNPNVITSFPEENPFILNQNKTFGGKDFFSCYLNDCKKIKTGSEKRKNLLTQKNNVCKNMQNKVSVSQIFCKDFESDSINELR